MIGKHAARQGVYCEKVSVDLVMLLEKVKRTIEKYSMLSDGERVVIALSGGPDSVCLLHIMNGIRPNFNLALQAVYIDHGLRSNETPREIEFCQALCKHLDIAFVVKTINLKPDTLMKKLGKQGAARELRYKALEESSIECGAQKIALAHHKDDQAETLLINLLRGSGMAGLSGIPPIRGNLIRPLIEITKEEIVDYLTSQNISSMTDSSNLRDDYLRNKVRSHLIPALESLNPDVIDTLNRTSDIFRRENEYLETVVTKTMLRLFSRKSESRIELFLTPLETIDVVLIRRILRRAVAELRDVKSLSFHHIEDIITLIKKGKSGDRLYLPDNLRVIRDYSVLILTTERPSKLREYTLDIGDDLFVEEAQVILTLSMETSPGDRNGKSTAAFDASKIALPLTVRKRSKGDYFYPSHFGKKKKIQDYFVDEKVARDERDSIPIICSKNDIIWVFGYRTDDRFIPDKNTKEFLIITSRAAKK